ncbi:MAG: indolepyruvate oxidoreductase subunit beta [Candidatus Hydrothermales bacterium]
MKELNIIISGVGGQGIILSSEILALSAMESGFDVKKSEVHGMAQRGGSVVSHVRIAKKVYSPLIEIGKGDILLSFEKAETLRWVHYLKKNSPVIIVNDLELIPPIVSLGLEEYPRDIEKTLGKITEKLYFIPAVKLAEKIGNIRSFNILLLGVLSNFLPFEEKIWEKIIRENSPAEFSEININAFKEGKNFLKI